MELSRLKSITKDVLFLDIETASQYKSVSHFPEESKDKLLSFWTKKSKPLKNEDNLSAEELYVERSALFPEFGRIICVSFCYIKIEDGVSFVTKTFFEGTEKQILEQVSFFLSDEKLKHYLLCAHNGKEFDFPYMCKRMVINKVPIPSILNVSGKKPWDIPHKDTMEMWRYGDFKSFISLDLLCFSLGIDSPKEILSGDKVSEAFYQGRINEIVKYCEGDTIALAKVYMALNGFYL